MTGNTREAVRNQLLLDARGGPVDLYAVDWHVRRQAAAHEVQTETPVAIREWVSDDPPRIGEPSGRIKRSAALHHSLDHSLHKISHAHIKHYDDPAKWMYSVWPARTAKCELAARSIEQTDIDGDRPTTT